MLNLDPLLGLFPSTDEAFEENWESFSAQYPWATRDDLWNLNAHKNSKGALPNPMESDSWQYRKARYQGKN